MEGSKLDQMISILNGLLLIAIGIVLTKLWEQFFKKTDKVETKTVVKNTDENNDIEVEANQDGIRRVKAKVTDSATAGDNNAIGGDHLTSGSENDSEKLQGGGVNLTGSVGKVTGTDNSRSSNVKTGGGKHIEAGAYYDSSRHIQAKDYHENVNRKIIMSEDSKYFENVTTSGPTHFGSTKIYGDGSQQNASRNVMNSVFGANSLDQTMNIGNVPRQRYGHQ